MFYSHQTSKGPGGKKSDMIRDDVTDGFLYTHPT